MGMLGHSVNVPYTKAVISKTTTNSSNVTCSLYLVKVATQALQLTRVFKANFCQQAKVRGNVLLDFVPIK